MNNCINKAESSAPAKVILFGEHFVVYKNPAIVAAINKRIQVHAQANDTSRINIKSGDNSVSVPATNNNVLVKVRDNSLSFLYPILTCVKHVLSEKDNPKLGINLDIDSQVPYGEGLGSSAASCVATVAALYSLFSDRDRKQIYETAKIIERNIHMNSSGVDCYVSTYGGIVNYEPDKGFRNIRSKKNFTLLIGTSGIKHSTGEVVSQVKRFKEKNSTLFKDLSSKAHLICKRAMNSMLEGNEVELGNLLTENHKLLYALGVSHPMIEKLIERCLNNGAIGAKLTGAGRGGAVIALMPTDTSMEISTKINRGSGKWMLVEFDHRGVAFS
jgi:mevalonate kinase